MYAPCHDMASSVWSRPCDIVSSDLEVAVGHIYEVYKL